jgi:hypothetical protein
MIQAKDLTKRYGHKLTEDGIDYHGAGISSAKEPTGDRS